VSATTVAPPITAAPMAKMRPTARKARKVVAPSGSSAVNSVANAVAPLDRGVHQQRLEFAVERMPDLGQAVRERPPGTTPVAALHRYVRAELERRAEWTGFHDGVAEFARVVFSSPTLIEGFGRMWRDGEQDLLAALAEAAGLPVPVDLADRLRAVWVGRQPPGRGEVIIDSGSVRLRIAVAQIIATLQNLTVVNQLRQSLGITTSECETETLAECDAAFDLLEHGLRDVTDRPAD
jgi:hypothetical protein